MFCTVLTLSPISPSQALFTNSSIDERGETEEEDHTYELLLSAQTKVPQSALDPPSQKGTHLDRTRGVESDLDWIKDDIQIPS